MSKTKVTFAAMRCGCRHKICQDWHVGGVAAVQGVHFTESQAKLVAAVLTYAGKDGSEEDWASLFELMTKKWEERATLRRPLQ